MAQLDSVKQLRRDLNDLLRQANTKSARLAIYDMLASLSDIESGLYRLPHQHAEHPVLLPTPKKYGFVQFNEDKDVV